MVRFIIDTSADAYNHRIIFTFQYGQIYYLSYFHLIYPLELHLHSNMVRFIIEFDKNLTINSMIFTFQYGQIYYSKK